jgi:hypothetical protein
MAEKATKEKSGISPSLILMGAVGVALIVFGLTKLGGPKGTTVNAKFTFDHQGPAGDYDFRVRFGKALPLDIFVANPDLVKLQNVNIEEHETWTPVEVNVPVLVPAKSNMNFPLPCTYDAEAMIIDSQGNVVPDGKVITENVFTESKEFEVIML